MQSIILPSLVRSILNSGGLEPVLYLCEGAHVMSTINIWLYNIYIYIYIYCIECSIELCNRNMVIVKEII